MNNKLSQCHITLAHVLLTIIALVSISVPLRLSSWLAFNKNTGIGNFTDFPEYYVPAKFVVDGHGADTYILEKLTQTQHQIFSELGNRAIALFIPPHGLPLLAWLGEFNSLSAFTIWKTLLIVCIALSLIILAHTFSLKYKQTCFLISGVCISVSCFEAIRLSQIAPILLLAFSCSIYFLRKKQDFAAGLFLSLMVLKPQQFLPFIVYLLGLGRWNTLFTMAGAITLLTIIALFEIGPSGFQNYCSLMQSPQINNYMSTQLTPTLRGQLMLLMPSFNREILLFSAAVYALVLVFSCLYGRKNKLHNNSILQGVLTIMPIGLATSLHCYSYDFLLLIPSILTIFLDSVIKFSWQFKLVLFITCLAFMLPLGLLIHYYYFLKGGLVNIHFWLLFFVSLFILYRTLGFSQKTDTKLMPK